MKNRIAARSVLPGIARREFITTTVNRFELLCGALSAGAEADVEALLTFMQCLPVDEFAANAASDIHRLLRSKGLTLPAADTLIAGVALSRQLPILTRNLRHFDRVPGLVVESP